MTEPTAATVQYDTPLSESTDRSVEHALAVLAGRVPYPIVQADMDAATVLMLAEVERLRGIEQRAREVAATQPDGSGDLNVVDAITHEARYILDGAR